MMMKSVDVFFDLTSLWLWLAFLLIIISVLVWFFVMKELTRNPDGFERGILSVAIIFILMTKIILTNQIAKSQPFYEFGYLYGILLPTTLFYICMLLLIIVLINALSKGYMTIASFRAFKPGYYLLWLMELSYCFAFSSPAGIVIALFDFIGISVQINLIPVYVPKAKED